MVEMDDIVPVTTCVPAGLNDPDTATVPGIVTAPIVFDPAGSAGRDVTATFGVPDTETVGVPMIPTLPILAEPAPSDPIEFDPAASVTAF